MVVISYLAFSQFKPGPFQLMESIFRHELTTDVDETDGTASITPKRAVTSCDGHVCGYVFYPRDKAHILYKNLYFKSL